MRTTGCDGVVVGRGCLGRPWLFRDLCDAFEGDAPRTPPSLGEVVDVMLTHAGLLADWLGDEAAARDFRKHAAWYTKGFPGSAALRERLMHVRSLAELRSGLSSLDRHVPFPQEVARVPRGKSGGAQRVVLPEGFLDDLDDDSPPGPEAEDPASGG
jgi:tRNA-dihydrouridine synthase